MTIGIIGFGTFGQFLAKGFLSHAQMTGKRIKVVGTSRSDYSLAAEEVGAEFAFGFKEFFEHDPDVVVFAVSILSFESVLRRLPPHSLDGRLIVDVLSVKSHPKRLLLDTTLVPHSADVCLTHPMFGPESGKDGWKGLPMVYEVAREPRDAATQIRMESYLSLFREQGCRMVSLSAEEHDEMAAGT